MSEWKPIETAPKDGTEIVIAVFNRFLPHPTYLVSCWFENGTWMTPLGKPKMPKPTHWITKEEYEQTIYTPEGIVLHSRAPKLD